MPEFTYTFDPRLRSGLGAYRNDQTGRIVKLGEVRDALDTAIDNSTDATGDLYTLLRERKITLADWQQGMRDMVKNVHLAAAISANGGYNNMTPADWGRAGQRIRVQYELLDRFARQIESGEQPLDGRALVRAKMYNQAAINTHSIFQQRRAEASGFDEERSVLDPGAKHCKGNDSCIEQANRGWVPIGTLVPIGQRICLTRCRCKMEFRNSQTGETAT